ncbi:MAG: response regulator, partial [Gammaproteobacteria bacterium]
MKVLLVDDDPDLLSVTGFALQQAGFLVVTATDGVSAIDVFEREQPDLAVLDINMPRMSGFDVARKLREKSSVPVIMLTVRGEEDDVVRALSLGADDYLTKPFSPKILIARIRAV